MTELMSSGHLGEGTDTGASANPTVGNEEFERRVLCMGYRCFVLSQYLLKRLRRSSVPIPRLGGEHDVCGPATAYPERVSNLNKP
jgi:hypothetical protein